MPNLRIVSDNAIARAVSIVASTTAGGLVAANLASDKKSSVHRAAGMAVTYTATWAEAEPIGCIALPFCNLSPTAQMRVRASREGSTTNYAKYSESFSNALWAKQNCAVGTTEADAAGVKAPSGASGVEKFKETASTAEHYISQTWPVPANQKVTVSFMVKAAERSLVSLKFDNGANTAAPFAARAFFDLSAGTVAVDVDGGWTFGTVSLGGGWYRIYASRTTTAAGNIVARVTSATLNASNVLVLLYTGTANSGFYIWGAQFEYGALSSYYPNNTSGIATRPTGYIDTWQKGYGYDSGWIAACPAPALRPRGFTAAQAASAYAYGGGACARHWFSEVNASTLIVDVADSGNLQGYIEAACLVTGPVWSPQYNASATSVSVIDCTDVARSAAGDQLADPGTISRKVPVDLRAMPEADRTRFLALVRNSRAYPILLSVFPDHPDLELERDFTVYGRRTKDSDIAYQFAGAYSTTLEIEEI